MRALIAVAVWATAASADPPGLTPLVEPAAPATAEPVVASYREQTAASDAAAVGLLFVAGGAKTVQLIPVALGTYFLGAPVIHLVHHRPGRAAASLALRVGLPILGAMIGAKTYHSSCSPHDVECDDVGPEVNEVLGVLGGALAASVIDTAFLAKGDEAPARPAWSPTVAAGRQGFSVGLAGSF